MCDSCALLFPPPLSPVCDYERISENLGVAFADVRPRGLRILERCFGIRVCYGVEMLGFVVLYED